MAQLTMAIRIATAVLSIVTAVMAFAEANDLAHYPIADNEVVNEGGENVVQTTYFTETSNIAISAILGVVFVLHAVFHGYMAWNKKVTKMMPLFSGLLAIVCLSVIIAAGVLTNETGFLTDGLCAGYIGLGIVTMLFGVGSTVLAFLDGKKESGGNLEGQVEMNNAVWPTQSPVPMTQQFVFQPTYATPSLSPAPVQYPPFQGYQQYTPQSQDMRANPLLLSPRTLAASPHIAQ